jgi:hypothetical protein
VTGRPLRASDDRSSRQAAAAETIDSSTETTIEQPPYGMDHDDRRCRLVLPPCGTHAHIYLSMYVLYHECTG